MVLGCTNTVPAPGEGGAGKCSAGGGPQDPDDPGGRAGSAVRDPVGGVMQAVEQEAGGDADGTKR